jgi:hypothetical protein
MQGVRREEAMTGLTVRAGLLVVVLGVALGAAGAAAAPAPAAHGPQPRIVRPGGAQGQLHRVRVCRIRQVRRRDRDRHWHNDRVKVCHIERVRR